MQCVGIFNWDCKSKQQRRICRNEAQVVATDWFFDTLDNDQQLVRKQLMKQICYAFWNLCLSINLMSKWFITNEKNEGGRTHQQPVAKRRMMCIFSVLLRKLVPIVRWMIRGTYLSFTSSGSPTYEKLLSKVCDATICWPFGVSAHTKVRSWNGARLYFEPCGALPNVNIKRELFAVMSAALEYFCSFFSRLLALRYWKRGIAPVLVAIAS